MEDAKNYLYCITCVTDILPGIRCRCQRERPESERADHGGGQGILSRRTGGADSGADRDITRGRQRHRRQQGGCVRR